MKRRDFIKAFGVAGATVASIPIATALANTEGAKQVIETFQMSDLDYEAKSGIYKDEYGNNTTNGECVLSTIDGPTLVLAPDYKTYKDFVWRNKNNLHSRKLKISKAK